jgi:hypothetical protein
VLSAESSLRTVPVVANLSFKRFVDRFYIFFLALDGLGSVSRTALTGGKVRLAFITEGNRGLMGNEKFRIVPISHCLYILCAP